MAYKRISHADHASTTRLESGYYIALDPTVGGTKKIEAGVIGGMIDGVDSDGGAVSNGAAGTFASANLYRTGNLYGAIGLNPFFWGITFDVPTSNPAEAFDFAVIINAGNSDVWNTARNYLLLQLASSGQLLVRAVDGAGNYVQATFDNFRATFSGRRIFLGLGRTLEGLLAVEADALALTATSTGSSGGLTWATVSIAPTAPGLRYFSVSSNGGRSGTLSIRRDVLLNCYPSAARRLTLALRRGRPEPDDLLGGSYLQRFYSTARNALFTDAGTDWEAYSQEGGGSGSLTVNSGSLSLVCTANRLAARLVDTDPGGFVEDLPRGVRFEFRLRVSNLVLPGGRTPPRLKFTQSDGVNTQYLHGSAMTANGVYSVTGTSWGNQQEMGISGEQGYGGNAGAYSLDISDVWFGPVGCLCYHEYDEGVGYQAHDSSANGADLTLSTFGLTWAGPSQRRGYVRSQQSWAGTHEAKTVLGQRALPPGAVPTLLTLLPSASSSGTGAQVGAANSASHWLTSTPLVAGQKIVAAPLKAPASTASDRHEIRVDPDSANYTGTIDVECHYVVTEGTP